MADITVAPGIGLDVIEAQQQMQKERQTARDAFHEIGIGFKQVESLNESVADMEKRVQKVTQWISAGMSVVGVGTSVAGTVSAAKVDVPKTANGSNDYSDAAFQPTAKNGYANADHYPEAARDQYAHDLRHQNADLPEGQKLSEAQIDAKVNKFYEGINKPWNKDMNWGDVKELGMGLISNGTKLAEHAGKEHDEGVKEQAKAAKEAADPTFKTSKQMLKAKAQEREILQKAGQVAPLFRGRG